MTNAVLRGNRQIASYFRPCITPKRVLRGARSQVAAALVSMVAGVSLAAVPFAPTDSDIGYWLFDDVEVGKTFTNPEMSPGMKGFDNISKPTAVAVGFDASMRTFGCRTYGDGKVVVTNDVPGHYLLAGADAVTPITDTYHALAFVSTNSVHGNANPSGWLRDMEVELRDRSAWTLEFFMKMEKGETGVDAGYFSLYGKDNSKERVIIHFPYNNSNKGRADIDSQCGGEYTASANSSYVDTKSSDLRDGKWHHIAITYEDDEQLDGKTRGRMRMILDYQAATGYCLVNRGQAVTPDEFRIRNSCGNGAIAGIRLSNKVLAADELLRASDSCTAEPSRIAFYPMNDNPAGWTFDVTSTSYAYCYDYKNKVLQGGYASAGQSLAIGGKAVTAGVGGTVVVSTNDVPGRYVYSSLRSVNPSVELESALFIWESNALNTESPLAASYMQIDNLAQDLAKQEEWTFEFFIKFCMTAKNTIHYLKLNNSESAKPEQISVGVHGTTPNRWYLTSKIDSTSKSTGVTVPGIASLADGRWHHIAYTVSGSGKDKKYKFFSDYTLVGESELDVYQDTADRTTANADFRIGQGQLRGMISCIRATAKALSPSEFQYASDRANGVLTDGCWSWRLDGKKGVEVEQATATEMESRIDDGQYLLKDGHAFNGAIVGTRPQYAAPVAKGVRTIGDVEFGRNVSSAELSGGYVKATSTDALLTALGRVFTFEASVNALQPSAEVAVIGAETLDGQAAWYLYVKADSSLNLAVVSVDGSVVDRKVMEGFCGADRALIVRADCLNREFSVFVDGDQRLSLTSNDLTKPLKDGLFVSAGGGCGKGILSGRIDEVRVNNRLLTVQEIVEFNQKGIVLIVR